MIEVKEEAVIKDKARKARYKAYFIDTAQSEI